MKISASKIMLAWEGAETEVENLQLARTRPLSGLYIFRINLKLRILRHVTGLVDHCRSFT
jgi:hypothetical protein